MSFRSTVAILALLLCAAAAQAGTQLFEASWNIKAFGNDLTGGTGASEFYSAYGIPLGIQCDPKQPRCPFDSTPTDGLGNFAPLGGSPYQALFCAPWSNWGGGGATARPAKGDTLTTGGPNNRLIPPAYRHPAFFSAGGQPNMSSCTATSTGATPGGKGFAQAGRPLTGAISGSTTAKGGFNFPAAGTAAGGVRGVRAGQFYGIYPYVYSYTYATLRNASGLFGPGQGPGSFSLPYTANALTVAKVAVKQGAAKFGGTMRMLGQLTGKVCYYRNGGCALDVINWRYESIGAPAHTQVGVVTRGHTVTACAGSTGSPPGCPVYTTTTPPPIASTKSLIGYRFPWTTGSVTVTAAGRGPHKTVLYAKGYDNRSPTNGAGTIQLVSPVLTRWIVPAFTFETGGIAIFRIQFVPEPRVWLVLLTGLGCLTAAYRWRP